MSKKTDDRLTQFKLYSPLKVIVDIIESIMKKRGEWPVPCKLDSESVNSHYV